MSTTKSVMPRPTALLRTAAAIASLAVMLAGCSLLNPPAADRPSAEAVVLEYLTAISTGNLAAARDFDALAGGAATYDRADSVSMLDNDVFGSAEHISDVVILSSTQDGETATVEAQYSLAGESHPVELNLIWNAGWVLENSMLGLFRVYAAVDGEPGYPLAFSSYGIQPLPVATSGGDWQLTYVAYPAIYRLDVEVDAALLADPSSPTQVNLTVTNYASEPNDVVFELKARE